MYNANKLKVFYDAEFTGLNSNSTLISIGLVAESGRWFYAEFTDYDTTQVSDWIRNNVINNLVLSDKTAGGYKAKIDKNKFTGTQSYCMAIKDTTDNIKAVLLEWLKNESMLAGDKQIQIYSDCYAYDWVLFNNLVCENGDALKLPEFIYYIPVDLSTALQLYGIDPDITREEFVGKEVISNMKQNSIFINIGDRCKHNSLWDAEVCRCCFNKLNIN